MKHIVHRSSRTTSSRRTHGTRIARVAGIATLLVAAAFTGTGTALAHSPGAAAADQKVDGVIVVAGNSCSWTNASTSAAAPPPSPSTAPRSTRREATWPVAAASPPPSTTTPPSPSTTRPARRGPI
ncbi:hypothetical protein WKI68_43690 [Streptomyces sp. MS1.HAVA.3]|uniref:Uncharacterized protein n=1 Tax=Streptomyces caledonius TaxID=3134107 RepID=A0ABU8UEI3_9ACTN